MQNERWVKPTGKGPASKRRVPKSASGSQGQRTKLENSARYTHWEKTGQVDLSKPDGSGVATGAKPRGRVVGPSTGQDIDRIVEGIRKERVKKKAGK